MSRLVFLLLGMGVFLGTLMGGWLHARFDVYGDSAALHQAARQLRRPLPLSCGNWGMIKDEELEAETISRLRCPAYINRVYQHKATGEQVAVSVLVGPAGALAAHVPEECYSPQDFTQHEERSLLELGDSQEKQHSFWKVNFRSQRGSKSQILVLYAWSDGSRWQASEWPRLQLGDRPYLYKIQIVGRAKPPSAADENALRDFSAEFTKQLQDYLIVSSEKR